MARKLKNVENDKCTLQALEHGEKTEITWKMKQKTLQDLEYGKKYGKNVQNEKCTLQSLKYCENLKIMENEKHTLQDLKYHEKN